MAMSHGSARVAIWRAEQALSKPEVPPQLDGWVYIIGARSVSMAKIGWALNPRQRLRLIAPMSPVPLELLAERKGTRKDEGDIHRRLKSCRSHGEWFRLEAAIDDLIREWTSPSVTEGE